MPHVTVNTTTPVKVVCSSILKKLIHYFTDMTVSIATHPCHHWHQRTQWGVLLVSLLCCSITGLCHGSFSGEFSSSELASHCLFAQSGERMAWLPNIFVWFHINSLYSQTIYIIKLSEIRCCHIMLPPLLQGGILPLSKFQALCKSLFWPQLRNSGIFSYTWHHVIRL